MRSNVYWFLLVLCPVLLFGARVLAQQSAESPSKAQPAIEPGGVASASPVVAPVDRRPVPPKLSRLVAAAMQVLDGELDHEGMARRARQAGWVPRVRVGMRRGQGLDYALVYADRESRSRTDDDLTLFATLTFRLDQVIFRREEVAIARDARAGAARREGRLSEVVALYFEYERARLERSRLGSSPERDLAVARPAILLNIFTNGAFDRIMVPSG